MYVCTANKKWIVCGSKQKEWGDYANYRIVNKSYASSYGILNGSPVKIYISRKQ